MAKVILHSIGSALEKALDPAEAAKNAAHLAELEGALEAKRAEVRAGWGEKYVARVHAKGKLTTWERIELLKDEGTPVQPVGTLVNYGQTFGPDKRTSPGAGVVTAFVRVSGRITMVIANDNTVASGSWWPKTPEKIERAQEMALRLRLPTAGRRPLSLRAWTAPGPSGRVASRRRAGRRDGAPGHPGW